MNFRCLFCLGLAVFAGIANCGPVCSGEIDMRFGEIYCERDSGPLKADVYVPQGEGPFPAVLVVHGGAWHLGSRAQLSAQSQMFARQGFTAVAISYRLAPKHKFPAQIEDCRAALAWMRAEAENLKIDPTRIGGFGYSAGAQLIALLGTHTDGDSSLSNPSNSKTSGLRAIACGGAPCEFRVLHKDQRMLSFWLGGTRREVPDQYRNASPAAFVSSDDPPMFFFHGEKDSLVPVESPKLMVSKLTEVGVEAELYMVPDTGHVFAVMDRAALKKSVRFLSEHLAAGAQP